MRTFVAALAALAVQAENIPDNSLKNLILEHRQLVNANYTPIQMTIDGKKTTKYIASDWCSSDDSSYICNMNNRGFIIDGPVFDKTKPNFYTPNLLGGSVEWDVNLAEHECGCFNTFYTIKVPALNPDGSLWNTDGYFYCDANGPGNSYCPEMDLMEANKYSFQTTPHSCNAPNAHGHYDWCDHSGQCAMNIVEQLSWDGYGPGSQYKINTDNEFHVKIYFDADAHGNWIGLTTELTQNGRMQSMTTHCDYLHTLQKDVSDGMAFIVSNWEGDDSWLTKGRCSGGCPGNAVETIKNINIKTGSSKPSKPSDPYDPAHYQFGDSCHHAGDDACAAQHCPSIEHCRWSWPWGDSFDGPHASCRCDILV